MFIRENIKMHRPFLKKKEINQERLRKTQKRNKYFKQVRLNIQTKGKGSLCARFKKKYELRLHDLQHDGTSVGNFGILTCVQKRLHGVR